MKLSLALLWGAVLGLLFVASASSTLVQRGQVNELTAHEFDQVISDHDRVLVKLYAPWCGHCRHLVPVFEQAATKLVKNEQVVVASVDAQKEMAISLQFSISGYPTIALIQKSTGKVWYYSGPRSADALAAFATSGFAKEEASVNFFSPLGSGGLAKRRMGDVGMLFVSRFREAANSSDYLTLFGLVAGALVLFGTLVLGLVVAMVYFAPDLTAPAPARPHAE